VTAVANANAGAAATYAAAAAVLARTGAAAGGAADAADPQSHQHDPVRRAQYRAGGEHDPGRHSAAAAAADAWADARTDGGQPVFAARLRPPHRRHPAAGHD